ncbi:hypothetical protein [Paenibacillus rhizophilus]|uniref:Uncharacterized protein n=1 Tax=Paenibacillus rhizophilus TaxID=1850366 RepID=A0A3N9Q7E1_9BACL|nr:hypothetical protein [Paenibacillus rhizophilus]RQW13436.1 hypothetical protein EH198_03160 [Paenibacillus rhizophilus]
MTIALFMMLLWPTSVFASDVAVPDDAVDTSGFEVLATYSIPISINQETNEITVLPSDEQSSVATQASATGEPIVSDRDVANLDVKVSKSGSNVYADLTITSLETPFVGIFSWNFFG